MYHGENQLIKENIFLELHNLWHMKCICLENKMEKMKCHPFSFCWWSDIPYGFKSILTKQLQKWCERGLGIQRNWRWNHQSHMNTKNNYTNNKNTQWLKRIVGINTNLSNCLPKHMKMFL